MKGTTVEQKHDPGRRARGFRRLAISCLGVICLSPEVFGAEVENDLLKVVLRIPQGTLQVEDRRTGARWNQYPPARVATTTDLLGVTGTASVRKGALLEVSDPEVAGTSIRATGHWKGLSFPITYALEGDSLSITIDLESRERDLAGAGLKWLMRYPYPFYHAEYGRDAYVPVQEGIVYSTEMVDGNRDPIRFKAREAFHKLSMPWWGLSDGKAGVMTYMNTFWDAMFAMEWFETDCGERALPSIQWTASQGEFDYPRTVTFRFIEEGGYVEMAKIFRSMIKGTPYFKSWQEKLLENGNVAGLKGAPYIWCEYALTADLVRSLRNAGFKKAILSKTLAAVTNPGEGIGPGAIDEASNAGYLIGKYHNYGWIREGLIAEGKASMDDVVIGRDGSPLFREDKLNHRLGGYYLRCSARLLSPMSRIGKAEKELGMTYFYADTISAEPGEGCYSSVHPVLRRNAHRYRTKALDALVGKGLVVSSEKGSWWAAGSVHIFHRMETFGSYTGPYLGSGDGDQESGGHYDTAKPGYERNMIGVEFNPRVRVPLFQLVYHDSVYCSRRRHADPIRAPELWNTRDLIDMLYGVSAMMNLNKKLENAPGEAGWRKYEARYLQMYKNVCGWHEQIGFDEMLDHRFLSEDRMVQETTFSSARGIIVNFGEESWRDERGIVVEPMSFATY